MILYPTLPVTHEGLRENQMWVVMATVGLLSLLTHISVRIKFI